ncbi:MAG: DUF1834 family protein [Gammaproteobacteria bacterium]|nr:DUF1834 family protein [Gammaproteobacteria bacterium]
MSVILKVEDACIEKLKDNFMSKDGQLVIRECLSIPGTFSRQILERLLQRAPGLYLAFISADKGNTDQTRMKGRFDLFTVTDHAKEMDRRHGNESQIGAYELLENAVSVLDAFTVDDIGTLKFDRIGNLFNELTFDLNATIYAATFFMPNMQLVSTIDPDTLKDFKQFNAETDMTTADGQIDIETDIEDLHF